MRTCTLIVVVIVLCSCSSKKKARYAEIAARANPVILKLRTPASVVLGGSPSSDLMTVTRACLDGIEISRGLEQVKVGDSYAHQGDPMGIDDVLLMFRVDAKTDCAEAQKGRPDEDCKAWCIRRYGELDSAVARLKAAAAADGVTIESLRAP